MHCWAGQGKAQIGARDGYTRDAADICNVSQAHQRLSMPRLLARIARRRDRARVAVSLFSLAKPNVALRIKKMCIAIPVQFCVDWCGDVLQHDC